MKLNNKTVMVTGGSSGIGLQLAKSLLAQGCRVLICARGGQALEQVKAANPELEVFACDLSDLQAVRALIRQVGDRIDIWVNNAGLFQTYHFLRPEVSFEQLQMELTVNFVAASLAITELVPYLKNKPESAIVNITAGMVYVPLVMNPMYNASKAALHSFLVSARAQLASTSIRVIEVAPPMVDTRLTQHMEGQRVSPTVIADAVIRALQTNRDNVLVGQVKSLVLLNRFFPKLMLNLLNEDALAK